MKRFLALALVAFGGLVAFERLAPRRWLVAYWHLFNPVTLRFAGLVPGWAVLETTGRKTGRRHRVPVGARCNGRVCWILTGHSGNSDYVKNIKANPQVALRTSGSSFTGTAHIVDPVTARAQIARRNPLNVLFTTTASGDLMGIRIDLD